MIGFMFETLGRTGRGIMDLAEAGVDEVISIPDRLAKGYNEGFMPEEKTDKVEAETKDETRNTAEVNRAESNFPPRA